MFSSEQASDYLLCDDCEKRFNFGGEKWVLANCWQDEQTFPLRTRLLEGRPVRGNVKTFAVFETDSIAGVDRDRLAYFGTSVIWRAAVHKWRMPSGDPKPFSLGPYHEAFRRYLMGEARFPENAALIVLVSASMDEILNKFVTFPWVFKREGGFHQITFVMPGITYHLCVGKMVPDDFRESCTAKSEKAPIYMAPATDKLNMRGNLGMLRTSRRLGKLARVGGLAYDRLTKR